MGRTVKAKTQKEFEAALRQGGEVSVGGVCGLLARVREGKRGRSVTWCLRLQGKRAQKVTLGTYPTIGLQEARERARKVLAEIEAGTNVVRERRQQREAEKCAEAVKALEELTLRELLPEWFAFKTEKGAWKNPAQVVTKEGRRLELNVPDLLSKPVSAIKLDDVAEALRPIWCSKRATADRIQTALHGFFKWAMTSKKALPVGLNPADGRMLAEMLPSASRRKAEESFAFLEPEQIPSFMAALRAVEGTAARCTEFGILTCSRSSNVRFMRWDQLDAEMTLWTIDAKEMKVTRNGQHKVPLSTYARRILREQFDSPWKDSVYVFPSPIKPGAPLCNAAMNAVIKRLDKAEQAAGREGWIDREQTRRLNCRRVAVQHAIARASFETWAHETRQDERAIQLCLHHDIDPTLHSAYSRDQGLERKRQLLESWGEFCLTEP